MYSFCLVLLRGVLVLMLLSFLSGENVVSFQVNNRGIPPILTAAVSSAEASSLLYLYATTQAQRVSFLRTPATAFQYEHNSCEVTEKLQTTAVSCTSRT